MSGNGQDKIYAMVTDRIMEALKAGTVPWRKPWVAAGWMPTSMSTRKPYRGVNVWLLALTADDKGYTSPWWGTYKHITELGGQVRKGEQSTIVVFWKRVLVKDDTSPDGTKPIFMLRYYRVFNADQADNLPDRFYPQPVAQFTSEVNEDAEKIIANYLLNGGPRMVKRAGDAANYQPGPDVITLPLDSQFRNAAARYATTFHEATHSTGHPSRLNREGIANFDHFASGAYAKEELVAEMGSAMLSAITGITTTQENSASYIAGWLKALENDNHLVISASAQAQKAADLIRGVEFESDTTES